MIAHNAGYPIVKNLEVKKAIFYSEKNYQRKRVFVYIFFRREHLRTRNCPAVFLVIHGIEFSIVNSIVKQTQNGCKAAGKSSKHNCDR